MLTNTRRVVYCDKYTESGVHGAMFSADEYTEIDVHEKERQEHVEGATGLSRITKEQMRKVESNDSPEIPDSWETSETPGLPSG